MGYTVISQNISTHNQWPHRRAVAAVLRLGSLLQRTGGGRADLDAAVRRLGEPWQRMAGVAGMKTWQKPKKPLAFRTDANTHQKNTAQGLKKCQEILMII